MSDIKATVSGVSNVTAKASASPAPLAAQAKTVATNTSNNHALLTNRDAADQHPTSAISGLDAILATKPDNAVVEDGYLWFVCNGEKIAGPFGPFTGSGGGGGSSNNAKFSMKNTSGWLFKSIASGGACPVSFSWSSIEDELPTGNGVLKVTVGSAVKYTGQIEQGENTIDVGPYLVAGSNTVRINVTDVYGNGSTLNLSVTCVALSLASNFDNTVAYDGAFDFPYTPTGATEKTMHFILDGEELGTAVVSASGREQSYTIPAQSHGVHYLECYFTAVVDEEAVDSNRLYYAVICTEEGNTAPIIATDFRQATVEQYSTLNISYIVYDPARLTAAVSLSDGNKVTSLTVDRTKQEWSYQPKDTGQLTLSITCGTTVALLKMQITEANMDVEAETNGLALHLSSYGRSNNEENPGTWGYGDLAATLSGFNFKSDGWQLDNDGITVLRVGGDARVQIPLQIFAKDFRTTGKTIEIEFASRSVLDYDAVLATCVSGQRGFEITAQQAMLRSEQSQVSTRYKEDDHLRLSFVIEKKSKNRLILGYVNGIVSGMLQYPDDDDFSQSAPVSISLGSSDCTIDIYNIRIYDNDLTRFQMLDNWIADTQDLGEKKDRYDRNNIFDDYGQILPSTLRQHQCYLIINCPVLPTFKGDKKTCSGKYVDPVHPERSFTFTNAQIDVQGTSSQFYYVKNFKIKFKGGFIIAGETVQLYAMNAGAVPTNEFTFKADVASSEGANNVVLAELYNDLCPVKTPAQEIDPRVRQCIEGHPIVVFHDDGSGAKFIGKYNFNNDKGTPEVFGFKTGDESWEIRENGNAQVSFKTADFTGWQTSFEARYPDGNTDISRLQQFVAWVASTDTTAAGLTEEEKAARLERFRTELPGWADVDDAVFYYLFTLIFLCIDQREKNAFPTWNAEMQKWLWLFYDADSSIGTDNKGNLTFEYWMEDIDHTEAGDPVFNGQANVFWTNVRLCFGEKIRDLYRSLRTELGTDGKPLLSFDRVDGLFTAHQSQWSEAIFNEDAWRKGVEPLEKVKDPQYLPMQQGKKEQHFKHWMYNRFRYLDSKFETGAALDDENRIMMRAHAQGDIVLTSFINMYGQVYYNAERAEHRMMRDQEYTFEWTAMGAEDAVIGVNSAPMITSLGDLSPLMLEYCHIQYATHLTELKVGDRAADYVNDNLVALTLGNNTLLRQLDARNCVRLSQSVDASGCTNLEHAYFDGTAISGLTLPNGGILKSLHLPGTITNLTIRNQPSLTEFVLPSYANITTLRLENVSSAVDPLAILSGIPANSRVRLIGIHYEAETYAEFAQIMAKLDTMRGLDENGNNVDKAQVSGTVHIPALLSSELADIKARYPSITVTYDSLVIYIHFYSEDGSQLLYEAPVPMGGNGMYVGAEPTKESTAQYEYDFAGWSKTPGGAVDADALANVAEDRSVYAVFTATVRSYTVRFWNEDTLLQTLTVPYGGNATYPGETPVKGEDYEFIGWEPVPNNVTADMDCYARFKYTKFDFSTTDFSLGYGVEWDYSQTASALTRIGLATGFSNPTPATSLSSVGSSQFDNVMPWAGMKKYNIIDGAVAYSEDDAEFSMDNYDTVVYIPEFYYAAYKDTANSKWRWSISPTPKEGYELHPGSGRYIGRYHTTGSSAEMFSKGVGNPLVGITRERFRTTSHKKGGNWWMIDIATWCAFQLLYLVEFADFSSQKKLGNGHASKTSGATDAAVYHTYNGGSNTNQYRWVEQPFGGVMNYVDGFIQHRSDCYIGTNNGEFSDNVDDLKFAGVTLPASGYITGFGYSNAFPWAFLPDAATGGGSSYYACDYVNTGATANDCSLAVGGTDTERSGQGMFYFVADKAVDDAATTIGSRLIYIP